MEKRTLKLAALAVIAASVLASCSEGTSKSTPTTSGAAAAAQIITTTTAETTTTTTAQTFDSSGVQGTPAPDTDDIKTEDTTAPETFDSSGVRNTPPPSEDSGSTHKNKDRWYRSYKLRGGGYEDYILVEYNQKKNYVSMQMMFIGVNAYMSVDSADLVPIDGQYWIQDFMNADGSEPDLTKVYLNYSASKITLYYWDANEEAFDFSQGQVFIFDEES